MKLLLNALYKLPLIKARVYRGVKLNLSEVHVIKSRIHVSECLQVVLVDNKTNVLAQVYSALEGKWFCWWSFSSTTLDLEMLKKVHK